MFAIKKPTLILTKISSRIGKREKKLKTRGNHCKENRNKLNKSLIRSASYNFHRTL